MKSNQSKEFAWYGWITYRRQLIKLISVEKILKRFVFKRFKMAKADVEMKEEPKQNDSAESEEPKAEVSKEEKERLVLEGKF